MHWRKYAMLLPPFILIGILLAIYLPYGQKHYTILAALVFWGFYYTWVAIEERSEKDTNEENSQKDINK